MPLESFGYIKDLVVTNPLGTDPKSQGDDHIRGVKLTLAQQFSGFTEGVPITVPESQINALADVDLSVVSGRNKLINGDMRTWQRGTSFSANNAYTADRWQLFNSVALFNVLKNTPAGSGWGGLPAMGITVGTGVSPGDNVQQKLENVNQFQEKSYTLSFTHDAPAGKNIYFAFRRHDASGTQIDSTGQLLIATGDGTIKRDSYTFTLNALGVVYAENTSYGTVMIYPHVDSTEGFNINQIQLEEGDQATEFELRHIQQELALCQRYTHVYSGNYIGFHPPETGQAGTRNVNIEFPVTMRAAPTISGLVVSGGAGSTTNIDTTKFRGVITGVAGAGNGSVTAFTADAEL